MKRFLVDGLGNLVFFAPIVILATPAFRLNWSADVGYLIASVPIALLGGRGFTLFLKRVWYPIFRERF